MSYTLGNRGEQKIKLEAASEVSGSDVYVVMSQVILAEDLEMFLNLPDDKEAKTNKVYELLAKMIKSWDIVDEKGQMAEITAKNIAKIPSTDTQNLQSKISFSSSFDSVKKNNSSSTSQPGEKTNQ